MSTQTGLFAPVDVPLNRSVRKADVPRLSAQHAKIIRLFKEGGGVATNVSMSACALRYSARINEMKRIGYAFEIIARDPETGVNTYRMHEPGGEPR